MSTKMFSSTFIYMQDYIKFSIKPLLNDFVLLLWMGTFRACLGQRVMEGIEGAIIPHYSKLSSRGF
jgi:hypothetical protein